MKRAAVVFVAIFVGIAVEAQKLRPDAFPSPISPAAAKDIRMAASLDEMLRWDRYPTYDTYVGLMQHFAAEYPALCRIDTIGFSVQHRLILALAITGAGDNAEQRPEFLYSSTMHGDEVTGFYLMLRLCDTLLRSYGTSPQITRLLDRTRVYINPLANPDGTYRAGNHTVAGAMRYNANYVDLNRNYPDPFGSVPLDSLQKENEAMIAYVGSHNFVLSANLHGGSEVMNYPWDSYPSDECLNEHAEWWKAVCRRYVDTCRRYDSQRFRDVSGSGYINGGDWYVIRNGRQDYFNYYCGVRELTMEVSTDKVLSSQRLPHYWNCQSHALINYMEEVFSIGTSAGLRMPQEPKGFRAYPNPTRGPVTVDTPTRRYHYNLSDHPAGVHLLMVDGVPVKVVKQ